MEEKCLDTYEVEFLNRIIWLDPEKFDKREELADAVHHWRTSHTKPRNRLKAASTPCGFCAFVLDELSFVNDDATRDVSQSTRSRKYGVVAKQQPLERRGRQQFSASLNLASLLEASHQIG